MDQNGIRCQLDQVDEAAGAVNRNRVGSRRIEM
jgi:hypothetical protein